MRLTASGKAAVDGAFEALVAAEQHRLAELPEDERQSAAGLLRSLLRPFP